jgi:hypothetical protein
VLLVIMPTLDDVDIAPVQRGDQSRGMVTPGPGGLGGVAVAPRRVVEGALSAVQASSPSVRANRRASSLMTMRYRLTRTSLCRSGYDNILAPDRRCAMRRPRLTRRPRTRGRGGGCGEAGYGGGRGEEGCRGEGRRGGRGEGSGCRGRRSSRGLTDPSQALPAAGAKRSAAPSGSTPLAKRPYRGVLKP